MKLSEDDLRRLFESEEIDFSPSEEWIESKSNHSINPEKLKITKQHLEKYDELAIKKIRKEIKHLPKHKPKKKILFIDSVLRFTALAGILGFVFFILINAPAYISRIKWFYYNDYLGERIPEKNQVKETPTASPSQIPTKTAQNIIVSVTPVPTQAPTQTPAPKSEGNFIKIDKLNITAPIIWEVEEDKVLEKLNEGVVHYKGTSLPGDGGNIFLVGHSSNYLWVKSDYNDIFALLDKLENGDRIEIRRENISYYYDVFEKKVVKPEQVEFLSNTNKEILTLMTCWPVGTNLNRLIVQAELVFSSY